MPIDDFFCNIQVTKFNTVFAGLDLMARTLEHLITPMGSFPKAPTQLTDPSTDLKLSEERNSPRCGPSLMK